VTFTSAYALDRMTGANQTFSGLLETSSASLFNCVRKSPVLRRDLRAASHEHVLGEATKGGRARGIYVRALRH
jgi:hypothetical protein